MNKLDMAHEFMMKKMETETIDNHWELFYSSWRYADAMQAEADKREPSGFPNVLRGACGEIVAVKVDDKEWQPDWSQAPMGFDRFVVGSDGGYGFFTNMEPQLQDDFWFVGADGIVIKDHGYQGDWQDSLRKRPQ